MSIADRTIPGVLFRANPKTTEVPLVFDSPHSGTDYPEDFDYICPRSVLRTAEDTYVHELYAAAPAHGATLIGALFPRSYIDANRHLADIDQALLAEPWPHPLNPGVKTKLGMGRFWDIEVEYVNQRGEWVGTESYTGFGYRREA